MKFPYLLFWGDTILGFLFLVFLGKDRDFLCVLFCDHIGLPFAFGVSLALYQLMVQESLLPCTRWWCRNHSCPVPGDGAGITLTFCLSVTLGFLSPFDCDNIGISLAICLSDIQGFHCLFLIDNDAGISLAFYLLKTGVLLIFRLWYGDFSCFLFIKDFGFFHLLIGSDTEISLLCAAGISILSIYWFPLLPGAHALLFQSEVWHRFESPAVSEGN